MTFKELKTKKSFKIITNVYLIISLFFVIWMLFIDDNSYLTHKKFNKEINDLENAINFYEGKIKTDRETIKMLQDSLLLERYAREKYLMKKENEDIYIIEFDTIKK